MVVMLCTCLVLSRSNFTRRLSLSSISLVSLSIRAFWGTGELLTKKSLMFACEFEEERLLFLGGDPVILSEKMWVSNFLKRF